MSYSSNQSPPPDETYSFPDEYADVLIIPEEDVEEEESGKSDECLCSFFDGEMRSKPTLDEYHKGTLKDSPLFANVYTLDKDGEPMCVGTPSDDPDTSILVTGFGIRNLSSLQDAMDFEERKRMYDLYKTQKSDEQMQVKSRESPIQSPESSSLKSSQSKKSVETETESSSVTSEGGVSIQQEKLRYLMGLEAEATEEEYYPQEEDLLKDMFTKEPEDKFLFSPASTTRSAQTYLRTHRIFDFFQYIIAQLLSAAPENPIVFILVLLNKILLYRSGTGNPPLLYDRKHIEQLFKLMDRMKTGFIELDQYESGMKTLGICEYNKEPELSVEGLVSKEIFVGEALESETALFDDLIKRKWTGQKPMMQKTFSDMSGPIRSYVSGTNFIPSDLMLISCRHFPSPMEESFDYSEEG